METIIISIFLLLSCMIPFSVYAQGRPKVTRYYNGMVLKDHQLKSEDLWICDGLVIEPQDTADEHVNVEGAIIAPGYIDIQINGGFGCDFTRDPGSVDEVARRLPKYGVTAFLPTVVSSSPSSYQKILSKIALNVKSTSAAKALGLHLEGPFFCPDKHGAHDITLMETFDHMEKLEAVYGTLGGVLIVTLAPELPGALDAIHHLNNKGIIVSAGHTNATYGEMLLAKEAGVKLVTHLFNAMRPFHHREPGVIGAVLGVPGFCYSIIADQEHVHPAAIKMAWEANPSGLILVTDAIAALGLSDGEYTLGGQAIVLKNGIAKVLGTDTLAGGSIGMDQSVRNFFRATGCTVMEALEAASYRPAKLLGVANKGTLSVGADADFLLLDSELNIIRCYIGGVPFEDR